jgi:hypothetical protein
MELGVSHCVKKLYKKSGNGVLHYVVHRIVEMVYFIMEHTEVPAAILVLD